MVSADGTQVWDITFYVLFRCVEFGLVEISGRFWDQ